MAEDPAQTAKGDEGHLLFFSRLEPHTGSGRNVETHTPCLFAIERQRAIHFKEVVVASDLNGTVAGVAYEESYLLTALVGDDRIRCEKVFAGNHKSFNLLNRIMYGNQFRAIGEGGFHLHIVDHLRHALSRRSASISLRQNS